MFVLHLHGHLVALGLVLVCVRSVPAQTAPGSVERIVSLAPSLTETVFALGAGDRLVGVSVYCDHPPGVEKIDRVGTFLAPNIETIVAKRPDLVLAAPSPANQNPVQALRRLGLRVLVFDPQSVEEILRSIREIGDAIGRTEAALEVTREIEEHIGKVRRQLQGAPSRRVLMVVGQTPLVTAGSGGFPDELIRLSHGINVGARGGTGWPRLSIEFAIASAPEVIIDTTFAHDAGARASEGLAFWRAFPSIPAVRDGRVHGHRQFELLRPGPRIGQALETMARFVHPERFDDGREEPPPTGSHGSYGHDRTVFFPPSHRDRRQEATLRPCGPPARARQCRI